MAEPTTKNSTRFSIYFIGSLSGPEMQVNGVNLKKCAFSENSRAVHFCHGELQREIEAAGDARFVTKIRFESTVMVKQNECHTRAVNLNKWLRA